MARLVVTLVVAAAAGLVAGDATAERGAERPRIIHGTSGPDTLAGTPRGDVLLGHAGDDVLSGLGGDDWLFGGRGDDTLDGGPGADRLWGGNGDDALDGGPGRDWLSGGPGGDGVACGAGSDRVLADRADRIATDCERVRRIPRGEPPPPEPDDRDGDGVADADDACPTVPAETEDGCPFPVATIGPAGGTIRVQNPRHPLNGSTVVFPAGAVDHDVVISLADFGRSRLEQEIGALPGSTRYIRGIEITADEGDLLFAQPVAVSLPDPAGVTLTDQLLVGSVTHAYEISPPSLVYEGRAQLGSVDFSVAHTGPFVVVSPTSPLVIASGRYVTSTGTPVAAGVVQSTGEPLVAAITDAAGAFSIPAGLPGDYTLLVAHAPVDPPGLAIEGLTVTGAPGGTLPLPEDLVTDTVALRGNLQFEPCIEPRPDGVIDSLQQPKSAAIDPFTLVASGPKIKTFVRAPFAVFGEGRPRTRLEAMRAFFEIVRDQWPVIQPSSAVFAVANHDVADVLANGLALFGAGEGTTHETAVVRYVQYRLMTHRVPCEGLIRALRPVEVKPELKIHTDLPHGEVDVPYEETLAEGGWAPPYTITTTGPVPLGLSVTADGMISGTPTQAGTFSSGIEASDTNTPRTTKTARVDITIVPHVEVATDSLPTARVGESYAEQLEARDGEAPYRWTPVAAAPGLAVNEQGRLAGTPTTAGTYTFTVEVTDNLRGAATKDLT